MPLLIALISGLVMSIGISYSQMIEPSKILGFLTLNKNWDPSLLLVMGSALITYSIGYWLLVANKKSTITESSPAHKKPFLDKPLVIGAILFGAGWGLAGYCPGPAIAALTSGSTSTLAFVVAMAVGWFISRKMPISA